jgi:hypothetical protein
VSRKDQRRRERLEREARARGKKARPPPAPPEPIAVAVPPDPEPKRVDRGPNWPNVDAQWKPGQSGNPSGSTKRRRLAAAMYAMIEEKGLDKNFAMTAIAMALGETELLKGRNPDLQWMRFLHACVDGPFEHRDHAVVEIVPDKPDEPKRILIPDVDDRLAPREDRCSTEASDSSSRDA